MVDFVLIGFIAAPFMMLIAYTIYAYQLTLKHFGFEE